MERLTEKIGNTNCVKGCGSNCKYGFQHCRTEDWENCKTIDDVIDKLAEYEDLEEQGLLLRLSCKVGDTIWYIDEDDNDYPIKLEIDTISIDDNKNIWYYANDDVYGKFGFIDSDFGKIAFLTKAEAEQKLKEMESD